MSRAQRARSTRRPPLPQFASRVAADHRILIRGRAAVLFGLLVVVLGALAMRVAQLQTLQAPRLQSIAQRQQLATLPLPPHRGRIFDRVGRPLVVNLEAPSIYAVPHLIVDPEAFARRIGPVLHVPADEITRRLGGGRYFVWLARKVSPDVAARVKALALNEQVGIVTETRRAYPNGSLAAHVLGFVGIDNQGLGGVEFSYDSVLAGHPGKAVADRDGYGRLLVETQRLVEAPSDGADLVLTIDQVLQHIAERELERAMTQTRARQGSVTILDPKSGEVLALAVRPTYDPNVGGQAKPDQWLDRPLAQSYEPGSTFKIFLSAAALDTGSVDSNEQFLCTGSLRVPGNHIIRDANNEQHGLETMGDIIRNSCNVGAAQIAMRLGKDRFYQYIRGFGFGDVVGIDLPGEAKGIVTPPSAWRGPGLQTIAFGQGISITALQLLTAATSLANEGVMVRPHVVRAIRDPQGRVVNAIGRSPIRQVLQPATARAVVQMMVGAVDDGTGSQAKLAGFTVAGKTGTAQKPAPGGGYNPSQFVASFLGFVPAYAPKLLILIILDEPRGAYFGGAIAAPVFRDVASQALWYLQVPPDASGFGESAASVVRVPRRRSGGH